VGPRIDKDELKSAQEFYEVKAQRHAYQQLVRVRTIGERLLTSVPKEMRPAHPKPFLGILLDDLTLTSGRVFGVPGIEPIPQRKDRSPWKKEKACLIVGILPDSPASRAGLQPGDLLVKVDTKETPTPHEAAAALNRIKPEDSTSLLLKREGVRFERLLKTGTKPYPVRFQVDDDQNVNAYAAPGQIVITTGLLRFISSDDELAVVMGHELAHLTQGHLAKGMGPGILAGIVSNILGSAIDIVLPGSGGVLGPAAEAGIYAPFSQNFEREADYVGLKYTYQAGYKIEAGIDFWDRFATELPESLSRSFFNTHPTSPERLLRLKKTVEELRASFKTESKARGDTGGETSAAWTNRIA